MAIRATLDQIRENVFSISNGSYILRNLLSGISNLFDDRLARLGLVIVFFVGFLAVFGPIITPYGYTETTYDEDGLEQLESPSLEHPLGTDSSGRDVFSRLVFGARPTAITGLVGGTMVIVIGTFVGVTAGYVGGIVEMVLMRITDFVNGIPIVPFVLFLISFIGISFWGILFALGLVLWRANARVLRSQVLQIKERPYIKSAEAMGASRFRIVVKHILPNIFGMAALFFTLGVGYAIIFQAGLSFIGVSNPFIPTWGVMIRNAYVKGVLSTAWWWSLPPAILISTTVLGTFLLGRGAEQVAERSQSDV